MASEVLIRDLQIQDKDREGIRKALLNAFTLTRYHASPEFARIGEYIARGADGLFENPERMESCMVAQVNSEVVGYEAIGKTEVLPGVNTVVYGGFAVQPQWQNKGIGKRLIQEATKRILKKGFVFGEVTTDACAWPAIRVYESVGLRITRQSLTYTVRSSQATLGDAKPLRRAEDDADAAAIQKIDEKSFAPCENYIHKEFPVADYNAHMMSKLSSENHLAGIKTRLAGYLLIEKDGETVGYLNTSSPDPMAEFFGTRLAKTSPGVPQGLSGKTLAAATRTLADEGAEVIDITVDYLENDKIRKAAAEVGFEFIYSAVDLTGKLCVNTA